jgi:hypothetical protein
MHQCFALALVDPAHERIQVIHRQQAKDAHRRCARDLGDVIHARTKRAHEALAIEGGDGLFDSAAP